jgi:putative FmdB family regulatory protein
LRPAGRAEEQEVPIYEFVCGLCSHEFEELVFRRDEQVPCPRCGSQEIQRKMSVVSFSSGGQFKSSKGSACGSCASSSCSKCSGSS